MTIHISDLMAGYQDDTVSLSDPGITTPERILALTLGDPVPEAPKAPRKIWRTVLIAAVLTVLLIVAAVAAAAPNFYEAAFGDRGLPDIDPLTTENDKGVSFTVPGIEWAAADTETAKALLGNYVVNIDETVALGDYTVHLDSFVMDEHGAGVLTWVMENPDGIPNYTEDGRLNLSFEYKEGLCEPGFITTDGEYLISRHVRNQALSTETELYLTTYLGHFLGTMDSGEAIQLTLKETVTVNGVLVERNYTAVEFPAFTPVPAASFTDGEHTVRLSPLSVRTEENPYIPNDEAVLWGEAVRTLRLTDGTEYVLTDEDEQMNSEMFAYLQHINDGERTGVCGTVSVFNRLVDPAAVTSIDVTAADGSILTFTPIEP